MIKLIIKVLKKMQQTEAAHIVRTIDNEARIESLTQLLTEHLCKTSGVTKEAILERLEILHAANLEARMDTVNVMLEAVNDCS